MKTKEFQKFDLTLFKKERLDIKKNLLIMDALHQEALALGDLPPKNPLEELEVDLRVARVVNCVPKTT